jgi:hypothetical protein
MISEARVGMQSQTCGTCGARVAETRRGRCWGCYTRWSELRPVGRGATCAVCCERRRSHLRLLEVHGRSLAFCHTCAAQTQKLAPLPFSIDGIRAALTRNRRQVDRRIGALDSRVFPRERRLNDRRDLRLGNAFDQLAGLSPDDLLLEMPVEVDVDESDIIEVTTVSFEPRDPQAPPARSAEAAS